MAYIEGCGDLVAPSSECCQTAKLGRVGQIAFYKKPFVDISDPQEWADKALDGTAVIWKDVNGELPNAEASEVPGYGAQETMVAGTASTITFRVPYNYVNNAAFRSLRNARSWFVVYSFEGQPDILWTPATEASIFGSPNITASTQDAAEATITVKWTNDEFPEYVAMPSGLFDCITT